MENPEGTADCAEKSALNAAIANVEGDLTCPDIKSGDLTCKVPKPDSQKFRGSVVVCDGEATLKLFGASFEWLSLLDSSFVSPSKHGKTVG
jgi:hypothetical protein